MYVCMCWCGVVWYGMVWCAVVWFMYINVCMYVCVYVFMYVCRRLCMYVCMRSMLRVQCMCIYISMYAWCGMVCYVLLCLCNSHEHSRNWHAHAPTRCSSQALVADRLTGPYYPISQTNSQPLTPPDWDCLDGTLYIEHTRGASSQHPNIPDTTSQTYLIFCHEFTQIGDGEICAIPVSSDLSTSLRYVFVWAQEPAIQDHDIWHSLALHLPKTLFEIRTKLLARQQLLLWSRTIDQSHTSDCLHWSTDG
jgi:hypothetical protein